MLTCDYTYPDAALIKTRELVFRLAKLFGRDMEWFVDREKLAEVGK